jgi:hypothetical protein
MNYSVRRSADPETKLEQIAVHDSSKSEDPWGSGYPTYGGARSSQRPDTVRDNRWTTSCTKGGCKPAEAACMSGADLSVRNIREGAT